MKALLHVTAMPALDPGQSRHHALIEADLTVADIVAAMLPGASEAVLSRLRIVLVAPTGVAPIPRRYWHLCRPNPGTHVVLRVVPGRDAARSILGIIVTVVSAGIGSFLSGAFFAGSLFAKGLITIGLTALGGMLINALLPPEKPERDKDRGAYSINGWRNSANPNGQVPDPFGRIRYAPPVAASSYSEVVGDDVHTRAVFLLGYGQQEISGIRIGETPIEKYDEVQVEVLQGLPDDGPLTLYTQQVIEESLGAALERPLVRNDAGEPVGDGSTELKPVTRFTARDVTEVGIVLYFGQGLGYIDNKNRRKARSVTIARRQRAVGSPDWIALDDLVITNKKFASFFRQFRWTLPARGAWEVEVTMLTAEIDPEGTENQHFGDCQLAAFQSFRPEYPLNIGIPMALLAVKVRATAQINGQLDNINVIIERLSPDWNGAAWVTAKTRNPASAALLVLRGPANIFPATDDEIDWPAFQDWHVFCTGKGLAYDRVHDTDASVGDTLKTIGAAGRAAVRHDGRRWTVVIDRPRTLVVDHLNPRNSSAFKWSTAYFERPDAFRIQFQDATNEYEPAERIVPWPGHEGEILVTAELPLPGVTDPFRVWIEARRRQYEAEHRAVTYSCEQDGHLRTVTPGDLVLVSRDILVRTMRSARVLAVDGPLVTVDETLELGAGSWAIRWRVCSAEDPIGTSVVRAVTPFAGATETSVLVLTDDTQVPAEGDLIHIGPAGQDSYRLIVASVERTGEEMATITMLPAAEIIDALTDAEVPPAWDGRVGGDIGASTAVPAAPVITGILAGIAATGSADGLIVMARPGEGSAAVVQSYQALHRLAGAGSWSGPVAGSVGSGGVTLSGLHAAGDVVELQLRAVSNTGVSGPYGPVVPATIPADNTDLPPQPADLAVVAGQRDEGSGPQVVLQASWTASPRTDLAVELQWGDAGTGFATPQKILLPPASGAYQVTGLTSGDLYDVRVAFLDVATGDRGPWATRTGVSAAWPFVLDVGGGFVLDAGSSHPLRVT